MPQGSVNVSYIIIIWCYYKQWAKLQPQDFKWSHLIKITSPPGTISDTTVVCALSRWPWKKMTYHFMYTFFLLHYFPRQEKGEDRGGEIDVWKSWLSAWGQAEMPERVLQYSRWGAQRLRFIRDFHRERRCLSGPKCGHAAELPWKLQGTGEKVQDSGCALSSVILSPTVERQEHANYDEAHKSTHF